MKSVAVPYFPEFNTKLLLIRFNRLLAWALLISPAVQIMMGTGFLNGLVFDLLLLLIHAALSLILFGTPRAASFRKQHVLMRFFGSNRALLAGRDLFLLDAWRILMSLLNPWVLALVAYVLAFAMQLIPPLGLVFLPLLSAFLYFNLLLAASILRHVRDASSYAFRRWRIPPTEAVWLGWGTMWVFVVLSFVNLVKGLWL